MRQTTKNILGVAAIALLSAGVAGYTTYMMQPLGAQEPADADFAQVFDTAAGAQLASWNGAAAQPADLTAAAESSVHAVVHIRSTQASKVQEVEVRDPLSDFFGEFFGQRGGTQRRQVQTPERTGFGSGVIISTDGYIVTNNHVVGGADEITVKLNDDREFKGRLIGTDPATDLALVKIDGRDLPTMPVGDSDALRLGEWVLAVGNPFNLNSTVTAGIVSAKARAIGTETARGGKAASIQSFIQTDAAINEGNSGGALVNAAGELVGINTMIFSPTGAYSGYGFAIPTSMMKKVVADLKQYGAVQRVMLGIKGGDFSTQLTMNEEAARQMRQKAEELGVKDGVLVAEVVDGGSAAGILRENDVITAVGEKKIVRFADLQEALQQYRPGDKVDVTVVRGKKKQTLQLTLKNEQGTTRVVKEAGMELLGAAFKPVTDELKRQLGLSYGLQVTGVTGGKMQEAGIRKGFIILKANGQPMRTADDMESAMKAAVKSPDQALFITGMFPSGKRAMFAVDLSQE